MSPAIPNLNPSSIFNIAEVSLSPKEDAKKCDFMILSRSISSDSTRPTMLNSPRLSGDTPSISSRSSCCSSRYGGLQVLKLETKSR
ncbi:hypothetical protein OGAPHI_000561 [Ogataea philodendri]|uniref:Uncharacterized protein n=1 Tax=Ogataea philodendri TaxID=1378263 RepID=A0A9P8PFI1_9ASCO|nr:uncharacterized protein OGAPHI_000561 [Ogataea philodendri]KAH3671338.1 hypothetical protein OGAPHI_000561 [Ogataea philodendri]